MNQFHLFSEKDIAKADFILSNKYAQLSDLTSSELKDLAVVWCYYSGKIEGNTYTYVETEALLKDNITSPKSFEDAKRVVNFYSLRWMVERFHFTMKTGALNVEKLQFDDLHTTNNALTFYSVVGWRLLAITHLSLGARSRRMHLSFLGELLGDEPRLVLMGDFNCAADTAEMQPLYRQTRLSPPPLTLASFPSWAPQRSLDHILTAGFQVSQYRALPAAGSDHLAVAISLY